MSSRPADVLRGFAESLGVPLGEAELSRIGTWVELLIVWNRRAPLTGDRDPVLLWEKHCADSITLLPLIQSGDLVVDVGSGAGLPGMILACCFPDTRFTLIEARRRACSFLSNAVARIGLSNVEIIAERASVAARRPELAGAADVVVARAVALRELVGPARGLLRSGGVLVLMEAGSTPNTASVPAGFEAYGERSFRLPTGERRRLRSMRAL